MGEKQNEEYSDGFPWISLGIPMGSLRDFPFFLPLIVGIPKKGKIGIQCQKGKDRDTTKGKIGIPKKGKTMIPKKRKTGEDRDQRKWKRWGSLLTCRKRTVFTPYSLNGPCHFYREFHRNIGTVEGIGCIVPRS